MKTRLIFASLLAVGAAVVAYLLGYSDGFDSGRTEF
jgi:ABC-type cobalt transport system substrate-binding protein